MHFKNIAHKMLAAIEHFSKIQMLKDFENDNEDGYKIVKDFFQAMGNRWMSHVQAVSMDMNAQYDSAFREWAPHVKIVYDLFHIVKLYNDSVITLMRRRKQNELKEQDRES